jgi:transcriptional regulator with XRE-family HTH domain
MTLTSAETLLALMRQKDFTGARLGRYAGCSRQFIHQLLKGEKRSMTPRVAENIAEALDVPLAVLFMPSTSSAANQTVKRRAA